MLKCFVSFVATTWLLLWTPFATPVAKKLTFWKSSTYRSPKGPCIHTFYFLCFPMITSWFHLFSQDDNLIIVSRSWNNETLFSWDNELIAYLCEGPHFFKYIALSLHKLQISAQNIQGLHDFIIPHFHCKLEEIKCMNAWPFRASISTSACIDINEDVNHIPNESQNLDIDNHGSEGKGLKKFCRQSSTPIPVLLHCTHQRASNTSFIVSTKSGWNSKKL